VPPKDDINVALVVPPGIAKLPFVTVSPFATNKSVPIELINTGTFELPDLKKLIVAPGMV
jgi:hypothetical protein